MIKKLLVIISLFLLSNCSVTTLTDETSTNFTAVATQGEFKDKVNVSWITIPFYKHYVVLRSDQGEFGAYLPVSGKVTTGGYEDTNVKEGVEYFYKVEGYNNVGYAIFSTEITSGYAGSGGGLLPPSNVRVNSGESLKSLTLKWDRVELAAKYEILKSTDGKNYEFLTNVPHLQYIDTNVTINQKYYYAITSINENDIPSPNRSAPVEGELFSYNVGLTSQAGAFQDKIVITWNSYSIATKYYVYRSESANVIGDKIAEVENTRNMQYTDTNIIAGREYFYTIVYQGKTESAINQSESVRSYTKIDNAPVKPENVVASKGKDPNMVTITWSSVEGATSYEVSRAISPTGPWTIIGASDTTSYNDRNIPNTSYIYYYTVTGKNPVPGTVSDPAQGWANRPPINIRASNNFGEKVQLTWDEVPEAKLYTIKFSTTLSGTYSVAGTVDAGSSSSVLFEHKYDIGNILSQELFYTVEVVTASGPSMPSTAVKGVIKKIVPPTNLRVQGNKTPTKSMIIAWNRIDGADKYHIYKATLAHRNADPSKLQDAHFVHVGTSQNPSYNIGFNTYPIRREVYMIKGVDRAGAVGVGGKTEIVVRYPENVLDFARDVDFTIVEAQTQIRNFGKNGSSGKIYGRAGGLYDYAAGLTSSRNNWNQYASFESVLHGSPSISIQVSTLSAVMNGPLHISGLYTGTITYNNLNAKDGGFVFAGSMTITYNHPTKGTLTETWNHTQAAGYLTSVVLDGAESPPGKPSYIPGHGI